MTEPTIEDINHRNNHGPDPGQYLSHISTCYYTDKIQIIFKIPHWLLTFGLLDPFFSDLIYSGIVNHHLKLRFIISRRVFFTSHFSHSHVISERF